MSDDIEGVAVSVIALSVGKGGHAVTAETAQRQVQLNLPGESSYANLTPAGAMILGRQLVAAGQRAMNGGPSGRLVSSAASNSERRLKLYRYYYLTRGAADLVGDPQWENAIACAGELRAIAMNGRGPAFGGRHDNPLMTRRYALELCGWLALDGWRLGPTDEPGLIRPPDPALFVNEPRLYEEVFMTATFDDKALDSVV